MLWLWLGGVDDDDDGDDVVWLVVLEDAISVLDVGLVMLVDAASAVVSSFVFVDGCVVRVEIDAT